MTDDITQMKIGKHRIGIIGFKAACQQLTGHTPPLSDAVLIKALMAKLGKSNYIPETASEEYETAFFKAYKAHIGEPVSEDLDFSGIEIKVLGQGCARCNQLEKDVMDVVSELNIEADIEHVKDIKEIANYGVLALPGLVINGEVKSAGNIPPKSKIAQWIKSHI